MKIRLLSDLHIEGQAFYYEYQGEDVVVLAGDIHTKFRHSFILDQIPQNVNIIMVSGNHEYYGATFEEVNEYLYNLQAEYKNFYYLQNDSTVIGNVEFYGGTMFTDMKLYDDAWTARQYAHKGIADFLWINRFQNEELGIVRKWLADDHIEQHNLFKRGLEEFLKSERDDGIKRVVISHFVPHPKGSDPKFDGNPLQPYFICDMIDYIRDVDCWLYGHTHTSRDFYEGNCRLVCNPRGYGKENINGFNPNLIVEI